jgi:hypothetical protein
MTMNGAFQACCPECRELTWVPENVEIDQASCSKCGKIFPVECPEMLAKHSTSLRLLLDPTLSGGSLDLYGALSQHGVKLDSTQEEILRVFPETPAQVRAHDELTYSEKRLAIDLLMYPLWRMEESNEPE